MLLLAAGAPLLTIAHFFWNNLFRRDNLTYFCQILLLSCTAGTISMCFDSSEQERFDAFEFIVLIPLPTRSMLFMISAYDSIAMYLAIEPQSLCFYVIAALPNLVLIEGLRFLFRRLGWCSRVLILLEFAFDPETMGNMMAHSGASGSGSGEGSGWTGSWIEH